MATTPAEQIIQAMDAADRPQKWTADKADIALSTFRRKLRGVGEFTLTELARIAHALGVKPAELLPDEFRDEHVERAA